MSCILFRPQCVKWKQAAACIIDLYVAQAINTFPCAQWRTAAFADNSPREGQHGDIHDVMLFHCDCCPKAKCHLGRLLGLLQQNIPEAGFNMVLSSSIFSANNLGNLHTSINFIVLRIHIRQPRSHLSTGPLWRESTCERWIPFTKGQ